MVAAKAQERAAFLGLAGQAMKRLLIDHARPRRFAKHWLEKELVTR